MMKKEETVKELRIITNKLIDKNWKLVCKYDKAVDENIRLKESTTIELSEVVLAAEAMSKLAHCGFSLEEQKPELKKTSPFKPSFTSYGYCCPECGKLNIFESEVTSVRCEKCHRIFDPRLLGKPDWKILDIGNLPDRFNETKLYEVEWSYGGGWRKSEDYGRGDYGLVLHNIFKNITQYRYRPTPTKKSHKELAEEYMNDNDPVKPFIDAHGAIWKIVFNAFIAGRKSMEDER